MTRDSEIIEHILRYCDEIELAICRFGRDQEIFTKDPVYRNAVSMPVQQIGELAKHLTEDFTNRYTEIPFLWMIITCLMIFVAFPSGCAESKTGSFDSAAVFASVIEEYSDDAIVSYALSDDSSFAALIIKSATDSSLSFYILEKDFNGWKVSACNKSGMLRDYDPLCLPHLEIGPNGLADQSQDEIYIQYESAELAGWDESLTIKKDLDRWSISEYAFYSFENHHYCPFYLFVIADPVDPGFNCLAQCSYCLKNCNFDISISSLNRSELRDSITAMFDYDTIEAWITRNPDIENYKNYYDWVMNR